MFGYFVRRFGISETKYLGKDRDRFTHLDFAFEFETREEAVLEARRWSETTEDMYDVQLFDSRKNKQGELL